jgi:hypothetical protein
MPNQNQINLFLQHVGVGNENEAIAKCIRAALQHNKTYRDDRVISNIERIEFRNFWAEVIRAETNNYDIRNANDEIHCQKITQISNRVSGNYSGLLYGGHLRFGTAQKSFNLYLKFRWLLDIENFPTPPHCPIDGHVLNSVGIGDKWTKLDCPLKYMERQTAEGYASLSEWESAMWNRVVINSR